MIFFVFNKVCDVIYVLCIYACMYICTKTQKEFFLILKHLCKQQCTSSMSERSNRITLDIL